MNGAQSLVRTLVGCGVDVCFMNPGTSEMHFVATLDAVPEMRGVLALFEGVAPAPPTATGGWPGKPAATLLHLGPGLGNGLANLHNARRARTPIVNIVGDHATYHKKFDAPLESDIEGVARIRVARRSCGGARPRARSAPTPSRRTGRPSGPPGQVATLVVPADVSWGDGGAVAPPPPRRPAAAGRRRAGGVGGGGTAVGRAGGPLPRRRRAAGRCGSGRGQPGAGPLGGGLYAETFPARVARGAGIAPSRRGSPTSARWSIDTAGRGAAPRAGGRRRRRSASSPTRASRAGSRPRTARSTCSPGPPTTCPPRSRPWPPSSAAGPAAAVVAPPSRPEAPEGELNPRAVAAALGSLLPEGAIVSDEGNTSSLFAASMTAGCPPHDWLYLTGGAIGQGLPVAVGAAVACPDRKVVALEADGSAMYTLQSWWTMARYGLDVTTVLFNNHSYAILHVELQRVGTEGAAERAREMLDLTRPDIDFGGLARALGLSTWRATTASEFHSHLAAALATPGPSLVEAVFVEAPIGRPEGRPKPPTGDGPGPRARWPPWAAPRRPPRSARRRRRTASRSRSPPCRGRRSAR